MRAAWWWIDRWRNSTAYTDMTAEEQGLYRNLLDEVWMRPDHVIPDDQRVLARVSGDHEAWKRSGRKVLQWMKKLPHGWTHAVALEVIQQSTRRAENQKKYRNKVNNDTDNGGDNAVDNGDRNEADSPSLSKTLTDNGALSLPPSQAFVTDTGLDPCSSNKGESGIPDEERSEYAQAVADVFFAKTKQPERILAQTEYYVLDGWMKQGVPLRVVLQGIEETRGVGMKLNYYESSVRVEYERWRQAIGGTV